MSPATATTVAGVANELVTLCRAGKNLEAIDKLYSPNIISLEPVAMEGYPAEQKGKDAIRRKNEKWFAENEVHRAEANGPFVGEQQFAVHYSFDVTHRPSGQRFTMSEMALYTVKDGKIVREQFFYHMPGQ
jgi:ketosteroid isomerase-like protein